MSKPKQQPITEILAPQALGVFSELTQRLEKDMQNNSQEFFLQILLLKRLREHATQSLFHLDKFDLQAHAIHTRFMQETTPLLVYSLSTEGCMDLLKTMQLTKPDTEVKRETKQQIKLDKAVKLRAYKYIENQHPLISSKIKTFKDVHAEVLLHFNISDILSKTDEQNNHNKNLLLRDFISIILISLEAIMSFAQNKVLSKNTLLKYEDLKEKIQKIYEDLINQTPTEQ